MGASLLALAKSIYISDILYMHYIVAKQPQVLQREALSITEFCKSPNQQITF